MHDSSPQRHAAVFGGGPIIDAPTVEMLRELGGEEDPGLLLELIELFLDDAAPRVETLAAAWEEGDLDGVARCAHALKSASANIGALPFSSSCKEIEAAARTGAAQDLGATVERCRGMYTEVQAALEEMRDQA